MQEARAKRVFGWHFYLFVRPSASGLGSDDVCLVALFLLV